MSYVWLVIAVDWEDYEVRAVLSTKKAAVARARKEAEREARQFCGGDSIVIERHRLDPPPNSRARGQKVEYKEPRPPLPIGIAYGPNRVASVGILAVRSE